MVLLRRLINLIKTNVTDDAWKKSLKSINNPPSSPVKLRFDLPWIPISYIAKQYYCELKVDHEYRSGEISTQAKMEGIELHKEILAMKPTTIEGIINSIEREPYYTCSFPVYAQLEDFSIIGKPDAIIFVKSKPGYLIELKTTTGNVNELWRNEVVQARIYAFALDKMGFDCSNLDLCIVKIRRKGVNHAKNLINLISKALMKNKIPTLEKTLHERLKLQLKIHVVRYEKDEALKDIDWAKEYWLMRREAIATKNPKKCKACEYRDSCPRSLSRTIGE